MSQSTMTSNKAVERGRLERFVRRTLCPRSLRSNRQSPRRLRSLVARAALRNGTVPATRRMPEARARKTCPSIRSPGQPLKRDVV